MYVLYRFTGNGVQEYKAVHSIHVYVCWCTGPQGYTVDLVCTHFTGAGAQENKGVHSIHGVYTDL